MLEDSVIALFLWIIGLYYLLNARKVQKAALHIQNKYPGAFPTRLPQRSWYPAFLRVGAVVCLVGAIFLTIRLVGQLSLR
jgi:hypothetical protein